MKTLVPQADLSKGPRYFILTANDLLRIHHDDPNWPGMNWGQALPFENHWDKLPK